MPPEALAAFQDALLELLAQDLPTEVIRQKLRDDPVFAAFRDYATAMEPRMIAVAVELMKKWGRRDRTVAPDFLPVEREAPAGMPVPPNT